LSRAALTGRLGFAEIDQHLSRLDELSANETLDLSAVTQVDSAGLSLLLELTRRSHKKGRSLSLLNAPAQLRELARFFKLDSVLMLGN
jgi:phospholipid transport system transporter-binding protein